MNTPTYDKSITTLLVVDPYSALGHSLTPASSLWMGGEKVGAPEAGAHSVEID